MSEPVIKRVIDAVKEMGEMETKKSLTDDEIASFHAYAQANTVERDGTQSQWADYTLRALSELSSLRERIAELERENATEYVRGREHEQNARRVALSSFPRELSEVMLKLDEAINREQEIRSLVSARNHCLGCGAENVTPDHMNGTGHTRSDHAPDCKGECSDCPVPISCGPIEAESTLEAVKRAMGERLTDEACEKIATAIHKAHSCHTSPRCTIVLTAATIIKQARGNGGD